MGESLQISGGIVGARFGEGQVGKGLLGLLVEHVEELLHGVDIRIGEANEVAEGNDDCL